jgi:hypothetical protein
MLTALTIKNNIKGAVHERLDRLVLASPLRLEGRDEMEMSRQHPFLLVAFFVLAFAATLTVDVASSDPIKAASGKSPVSSELAGGWRFVRTPNPNGGSDAISIMHTADVSRSDLDLAGLMIRCSENGTSAFIVLIHAFPFRARPHVLFGKPGNEIQIEATIAPPGTTILLPGDAKTLVNGTWQAQDDLFVRVDNGQTTIRGVVALAGVQAAFKVLVASCPYP